MFYEILQKWSPKFFKNSGTWFGNYIDQLPFCGILIMDLIVPWNDRITVYHVINSQLHHKLNPTVKYGIIRGPGSIVILRPGNHVCIMIIGLNIPRIFVQGGRNYLL